MTYFDDGYEYTIDGDIIDNRDQVIKKIKSKISVWQKRDKLDQRVRESNPAVMEAWQKYQTLLTLARPEND